MAVSELTITPQVEMHRLVANPGYEEEEEEEAHSLALGG